MTMRIPTLLLAILLFVVTASVRAALPDCLPMKEKPISVKQVKSKRGTITVETYRDDGGTPRTRSLSKHYEIYSELTNIPPEELSMIMEAAWEQMVLFFGVEPTVTERWKIELYRDHAEFVKHKPMYVRAMGVYTHDTKTAYTHTINGPVSWTRTLMVHEAAHQFHFRSGVQGQKVNGYGNLKMPFMIEGVATFVEGHRWDRKSETLYLGTTLPGRSRSGLKDYRKLSHTFDDLISARISRDLSFNLVMYLVHRHPNETAKLLSDKRDGRTAWKAAFGTTDMPESFWKEFEEFQEVLGGGDDALGDEPKVRFSSWEDVISPSPIATYLATLGRVESVLGQEVDGMADLRVKLEEMGAKADAKEEKIKKSIPKKKRNSKAAVAGRKKRMASLGKVAARTVSSAATKICTAIVDSDYDDDDKSAALAAFFGITVSAEAVPHPKKKGRGYIMVTADSAFSSAIRGKVFFEPGSEGIRGSLRQESITLSSKKAGKVKKAFQFSKGHQDVVDVDLRLELKWRKFAFTVPGDCSLIP